ncbi:MAG: phosphomethylpyrimidine synthase ThiC [Thermosulfidibacteraceae bacterium]|jgi:phosphomethylpyrimidine synthase
MTQLEAARKGIITEEMKKVAVKEEIDLEELRRRISEGTVIIPINKRRKWREPIAIGKGLSTKVNANIGTSSDYCNYDEELLKMKVAVEAGADSVMDLSTGGDLDYIRRLILKECQVMVGTVPIYQAAIEWKRKGKPFVTIEKEFLFDIIRKHAEDGVDFITVHCGVTLESMERMEREGRVLGVVSRGGAFIVSWMRYNKKENPLFEYYDELLDIAKEYDLVLSLGDGFRPGSVVDATDRAQIQELIILGELVQRAWEKGVQVMVEGPGHVPLNQIEANILLQKRLCHNAPFYVLGPLVTDSAPGYDHIVSAIGGALAAWYGADFLCYVTPSEHLRLPTVDDVREGVIAARIAAHAADIAKGIKRVIERDRSMSMARWNLDWETQFKLAIDPVKAKKMREERIPSEEDVCTMCGEYCAIKMVRG